MAHWEDILPVDIHEISYEQLVRSPEREIRSLVRTCGLEFEESCLEFHKTRRAVTTASATQVRRPIYTSSIGKWRHYKKHLTPLRETLEEEGIGSIVFSPLDQGILTNKYIGGIPEGCRAARESASPA